MTINIHSYSTVAYAYLDLSEVTDTRKMYYNMISKHQRNGDLINLIKVNNRTLHIIAKDKDALIRIIISAEFINPQLVSQEPFT